MDHKGTLPLGSGDKDGTHAPLGRKTPPHPGHVGLLPGDGDTTPSVETPLDHLEAVIQQKLPEPRGGFPLYLCPDRKVEGYKKPSHFQRV